MELCLLCRAKTSDLLCVLAKLEVPQVSLDLVRYKWWWHIAGRN